MRKQLFSNNKFLKQRRLHYTNSVDFKIKVNGVVIQNFNWSGSLSPQSSANTTIPSITIQNSGEKELQIIGEI